MAHPLSITRAVEDAWAWATAPENRTKVVAGTACLVGIGLAYFSLASGAPEAPPIEKVAPPIDDGVCAIEAQPIANRFCMDITHMSKEALEQLMESCGYMIDGILTLPSKMGCTSLKGQKVIDLSRCPSFKTVLRAFERG